MIKSIFIFISIAIFSVTSFASKYQETRRLDDFHSIKIQGNFKVELVHGDSNFIVMKSETVELSKVTTATEKGELKVELVSMKDENEVFVVITYQNLDELTIRASANVIKTSLIMAANFKLRMSSGALGQIKLKVDRLEVSAAQGAEVFLYGNVAELNAEANTGGKIHAYKVETGNAAATSASGALVWVKPSGKLNAKANTGGKIYYQGTPSTLSQNVSLGGEVIKDEL